MVPLPGRPTLSVRRAGTGGGVPLLLLHGFPCTSLIWAKVMAPLAVAGFDVVAPDLRGFGDSDLPADGYYDLAAHSGDVVALCAALGWTRVVCAGHDLGASVLLDLSRRHPQLVDRLLLMNHVMPGARIAPERAAVFDYAVRQGEDADGLLAELATPTARQDYVKSFYTDRGWCPPDAFTDDELDRLTAPFGDADRLRASFRDYEVAAGRIASSAQELVDGTVAQPVSVLLGLDDVTLAPDAAQLCRRAYPNLTGPLVVGHAGHYLQWEQATAFVTALVAFAR